MLGVVTINVPPGLSTRWNSCRAARWSARFDAFQAHHQIDRCVRHRRRFRQVSEARRPSGTKPSGNRSRKSPRRPWRAARQVARPSPQGTSSATLPCMGRERLDIPLDVREDAYAGEFMGFALLGGAFVLVHARCRAVAEVSGSVSADGRPEGLQGPQGPARCETKARMAARRGGSKYKPLGCYKQPNSSPRERLSPGHSHPCEQRMKSKRFPNA